MKIIQLSKLTRTALFAGLSLATSVAPSFAALISFSVSAGVQPSNVGTITLTEVNATTVKVLVDLLPGYGIMNSGQHLPFSFNLASESNVSVSFITPPSGTYAFGTFSLDLAGGTQSGFGTFGAALVSTAGNGSGKAFYGDLEFSVIRTGGLTLSSFLANSDGYFFAADLTDGKDTGVQGWKTSNSNITVPDSGATLALMGLALTGLALARRFAFKS